MHKTLTSRIVLLALLSMPAWAAQVYTKEEAVKIALEKSSDIQSAEQKLEAAEAQVSQTYGAAYPKIDFSATYARTFGVSDVKSSNAISQMLDETATTNERILAGTLDAMSYGLNAMQGFRWGTQVGLTATQILYAQGKVATGTKIAKHYRRVNELSLENAKISVRFDVEQAFDQMIYLDSALQILEASKAQLEEHINYVKQAQASGLATELDAVRAEIQLDNLNSALAKTEKDREVARNALLNTMGLPWNAEASFSGTLRDPTVENYPIPDTSMSVVRSKRKELAQLNESEQMYQQNINIAKGDYKPTVVLGGSITYQNGQNRVFKWDAPDWDENISKQVYLNVSMNLFNGMQTRESVAMAKTDLRSNQIQKESAERGIKLQIESSVNTLNDAFNQIGIRKRQVELATKNFELTEAAYKVRRDTQLNLLDATMELRSAKLDYMNALLNWNSAYNALLKATGEF